MLPFYVMVSHLSELRNQGGTLLLTKLQALVRFHQFFRGPSFLLQDSIQDTTLHSGHVSLVFPRL